MRVVFFAAIREAAGVPATDVQVPAGATVAEVRAAVLAANPGLRRLERSIIAAVNRKYAEDSEIVPDGAEVAFFPPVTGGSGCRDIIRIQAAEIDLNEAIKSLTSPTVGGICAFTGTVRAFTASRPEKQTIALEYTAYTEMANEMLEQVAAEMRTRWPRLEGILLVQRTGRLEAGVVSTLAACSAAHRDDGIFEAARYAIDRIKEIVPVWKKEIRADGEEWLEGEHEQGEGGQDAA